MEGTPEELDAIRLHLERINKLLRGLFGPIYSDEPESLQARAEVADIIEQHFDAIVAEWEEAIGAIFGLPTVNREAGEASPDLVNALIRFAAHLRDPNDLQTYVHLRKHCQQGMLSRAQPSQFNTIHIALKQIILKHIYASSRGRKGEALRDIAVASIDERRLMVSWFYIESREAALRASEEKYRNLINHAPDPMYEIDADTFVVLGANSAAERLHRMLPGEEHLPLIGRSIADFVPEEARASTIEHFRDVVRNGAGQTMDLPLGSFFFDENSSLITYGNQRFIHMILRDVTHRKEMMDELLKAERLAAAGTFAAGVAHEVNNPLASISSLVQSLLSGEADATRRTTLSTILSQITRISGTLKDLFNFARPTAAQRKAVNLNQLISETLRLAGYNKRFNGIMVSSELAADLETACCDDNEIQQVVLNLLFNAADATQQREGGMIRVVTENHPPKPGDKRRYVVIRIIDNGIGIPKEHLKRVFDPFFTTKPAGSGVGLGLSMCQRIIIANGGILKLESQVGKGTTVIIGLPAMDPTQPMLGVGVVQVPQAN
ncbi:MAG TPA: ATP-binding protein [Candidatus Binataceae bacterium]|nr:ATP-binding protein [Candidatus Binataceae bacterium]